MSRVDNEIRITPSVLDRLLDDRPDETREAPISRQTSVRLLKDVVRRDLEWLLNTRLDPSSAADPDLPEVSRSLAMFGLPDFTAVNVFTNAGQEGLRRVVERTIKVFEPRLEGVRVKLERVEENERAVRFRIEAELRVEPAPEPVVFDTMLEPGGTEFRIKET